MPEIRLLLVDDHALVRGSLKSFISDMAGVSVVAEAGDGREALDLVAEHKPDIVLMDLSMPGLNGIEATRRIGQAHPKAAVVALSMHAGEDFVRRALNAGALGYVLKSASPAELELAIRAVARGERYLSPAVSKQVIDAFVSGASQAANALDQLTARQREVLQLVAEGKTSKQIAQLWGASVKTVESHRAELMRRLQIQDVATLVRFAISHGLVSAED